MTTLIEGGTVIGFENDIHLILRDGQVVYDMGPEEFAGHLAADVKQLVEDEETGQKNYCIVQAEDELASINQVIGASFGPICGAMTADYILSGGNERVILCERGIRTFETATRSTLDVSAVPVPAAVWLFGSALGLMGFARRRRG